MNLGKMFYDKRKAIGLTQDEVADTGLISRTAYKRIERGNGPNSPSLWVLESIAEALGCKLEVKLIDMQTNEEVD